MDDVGHSRIRDTIKSSRSQRQRLADDDGIKFFRLIHVICQSPPEIFTATYRSVHALPQHVWDTLRADPHRSNAIHQQNDKKLSAFLGFSGCRQAHKCAVFPKSQDYEAIWGPQLKA